MQRYRFTNPLILWLFYICLFGLFSSHLAWASNEDKIDKIFETLDSGSLRTNLEYQLRITELKTLIAADDLPRIFRLKRAQCWAFDPLSEGQSLAAVQFSTEQHNNPKIANFPSAQIDLKLCQSWFNQQLGHVALAMQGYNEALDAAYRQEDLRLIADAHSMRGSLHSFQGDFSQALEDLITAQHLFDQLNLPNWGQQNLSELATSYRRFGDSQNAIRYYQKLEDTFRASKDMDAAIRMSTAIAIANEEQGQYAAALIRFQEGYNYWKSQNNPLNQASVAVNMAGTLIKLERVSEAITYLDEASEWIKPGDDTFYSFMKLFKAQAYLLQNNTQLALDNISEAKAAFKRVKNARGMAQLHRLESQIYIADRNWKEALDAIERYIELRNELDAKMQAGRTTEMRTRFNSERIEGENRRLIENQRLKEQELEILQQNKILQLITLFLGGIIFAIVAVFALKQSKKSKHLSVLAMTDALTELPNRRYIYSKAEKLVNQSQQQGTPLSVILFDVDHFKKINDEHGHEAGDKALISLAQNSSKLMRKNEIVGRVGGEEFLVVLPDTDKAQALLIAKRLVQSISTTDMTEIAKNVKMTISAGVASLDKGSEESLSKLLKRADNALYDAKKSGRNCAKLSEN